jgi:PAS domain S-box-containing protein
MNTGLNKINTLLNIFSYSSDIILELDTENNVKDANTAAEKYFNTSKSLFLNQNLIIFCKQNHFLYPSALKDPSKIEKPIENITKQQFSNHSFKLISWKIIPIYEGQVISSFLLLGQDVTQKLLGETALKNVEERLGIFIESIAGYHWWKDLEGRYLGCNNAVVKLLGLDSPQDVVGKTDYELPWAENAQTLTLHDRKVIKTGETVTSEEVIKTKTNMDLTFFVVKMPLKNDYGDIIGTIGNSINITELKTTQSRLREAEERLAGIRALSASVAHELRTPLSTIQFSISGTKNYIPALVEAYNLAKEHRLKVKPIQSKHLQILLEMLDSIESEVRYAGTIINMTLMNVRQNGISKADFKACSMKACVTEALRRYPFKPDEAKLIEWSNKEDFTFEGDKTLMVHILFNLMKNAFYYIEAAKKGKIQIWYSMDENNNILHFKDTSMGIPNEELPKLFERFYTTTRHGTGLGLAFCKMAMTSFGGSISCKSKYGEFTQFEMYFPKEISTC